MTAIETANPDQLAMWDGEEGTHWTEHADHYDRAAERHWQRLVDAGLVRPDDAVLDVGCGTGKSTRDLGHRTPGGSVLGVDLSGRMLDLARQRTADEGLTNVSYLHADAQVHTFAETRTAFDLAVSSFGAMFFSDPVAAFTNLGRALRPGGQLALLTWRALPENEWLMTFRETLAMGRDLPLPPPEAPTPFSLADRDRTGSILAATGFGDVVFEAVDEPIDLGPDVHSAFAFMQTMGIVRGLSHDLDATERTQAMAALRDAAAAHAGPDGVLFDSAAWLITARSAG